MLGHGDLRDLINDWVEQDGHLLPPNMSIPSHHFKAVWNSAVSRWRLRPGEGITDSQKAARFDEADIKRALFGIEEASKSN